MAQNPEVLKCESGSSPPPHICPTNRNSPHPRYSHKIGDYCVFRYLVRPPTRRAENSAGSFRNFSLVHIVLKPNNWAEIEIHLLDLLILKIREPMKM